jgi:phage shock protein PspC (stress-responsive transcriptional regulator)
MGDRLYRSRHDRMLAGVAGGLAEMWGADPSLVRVIWALLVIFTGGIALLVYIVMAIVVPEEDEVYPTTTGVHPLAATPTKATLTGETAASSMPFAEAGDAAQASQAAHDARLEARAARRAARAERGGGMSPGLVFGGFLILLGAFFLVREFLPQIDFDWFWPLILVLLGLLLVVTAMGRGPRSGGSA